MEDAIVDSTLSQANPLEIEMTYDFKSHENNGL